MSSGPKTYNESFINERCTRKYGVTPRYDWIATEYGGERGVAGSSNVVFSNGLLDPWSSGGVTPDKRPRGTPSSVAAVVISEGAHHLDLMFSQPDDPPSVVAARKAEVAHMHKWVEQAYARLS